MSEICIISIKERFGLFRKHNNLEKLKKMKTEDTNFNFSKNDNLFPYIKNPVLNSINLHKQNCAKCDDFEYCSILNSLLEIGNSEQNEIQILEEWFFRD
jgi:hypothetical protein